MRYFFHIAYSGTRYNGWQKLPDNNSIQRAIEKTLSQVLKTSITIVGCGRTDTGVHASQYFFHADFETNSIPDLHFRLNKMLPHDIAVFEIIPVSEHAHARTSATERTYTYFIHHTKDPFLHTVSSFYQERDLNLENMKKAAAQLTRHQDYRFFHRTASKPKTTICKVTNTTLSIDETGDRLKFTISANRFLRGMVRIVVHKLLEVGRNKITMEQFENYLNGTEAPDNIKSAHAQGLYLSKVSYPFLDIPARSKFDLLSAETEWQAL